MIVTTFRIAGNQCGALTSKGAQAAASTRDGAPELVVNEDNGEPYDESTYRHWVSTARAIAVFGFLARDTVRQAIVRAERLTTELIRNVDKLFAPFPLDEESNALRARTVDQRARACWRNGWMRRPRATAMATTQLGVSSRAHR
jgi:hypothetical protein